jgi:dynein heavy chain
MEEEISEIIEEKSDEEEIEQTEQNETRRNELNKFHPQEDSLTNASSRDISLRRLCEELQDQFQTCKTLDTLPAEEHTDPFTWVLLSECLLMNQLLTCVNRSLIQIDLVQKGELILTDELNTLMNSLYLNRVPSTWSSLSSPSLKSLSPWCTDLILRYKQLRDWLFDLVPPSVVWIGGLFQPQSFLTAIIQHASRRDKSPLDEMTLVTDITSQQVHELTHASSDGTYVSGMFLQGAHWNGQLTVAPPKQLFCPLPVACIRAVPSVRAAPTQKSYACPVFYTSQRGRTYVWTAQLPSGPTDPAQWTLGGVAIILNDD